MYHILLVTLHIVVCFALILIVLLQTGKGADIGAAFGGGSSNTLFGSSGPTNFLSKATTGAAILFMFTSLILAIPSGSAVQRVKAPEPIAQEQMDVIPTPMENPMSTEAAPATTGEAAAPADTAAAPAPAAEQAPVPAANE